MKRRPAPLPLADALELACIDEIGGDPPGPMLARRLERVCQAVLHRRGVEGARVVARSGADGTFVEVALAKPGRRVEQLVLRLG